MTEEKKPEETTKTEEAPKAETPKTEEVPKADVPKKKTASKKSTDFQKPETVEDAVKLYNEMVLTAIDVGISKVIPVEKFVDLKTGVRACERLHESIQKARGPKSSKKEKDDMPKKTAKKSTTKKKAAKKSGARGPIAKITDETKVTWVSGKENPYREGTGKWKRTEVVRTSCGSAVTVKTLQGKKVKRGTIRTLVREGVAKLS